MMAAHHEHHAELMRRRAARPTWSTLTPAKVADAISQAAMAYGVSVRELKDGSVRTPPVVFARTAAARSLRDMGYSSPSIGRFLSIHHTSVLSLLHREPSTRGRKVERVMRPVVIPEELLVRVIQNLEILVEFDPSVSVQKTIAALEARRANTRRAPTSRVGRHTRYAPGKATA